MLACLCFCALLRVVLLLHFGIVRRRISSILKQNEQVCGKKQAVRFLGYIIKNL
jgi:hypothetical protein